MKNTLVTTGKRPQMSQFFKLRNQLRDIQLTRVDGDVLQDSISAAC